MSDDSSHILRSGKDLLDATRPYAVESRWRSWWCTGSTFVALGTALVSAALVTWWPLRLAASMTGGLLFVRAFILVHDFEHGALLRGSRLADALFFVYGLVALTPPRNWRHSHNIHHANVGKPLVSPAGEFSLMTSDVGAYPLITTDTWQQASLWQRLRYRIMRHPLTILCAYVTVFLGSLCLAPLMRDPRRNRESVLALIAHAILIAVLWMFAGPVVLFFAFVLPFAIATALGAYLFYAQHTFPGMRILPVDEWSHYRGALESSSYLRLGLILRWFTGNIGYHHVHHLNALIPFYRLPEAMDAIPELQQPTITSLRPSDIRACLRLNLWDLQRQTLVSYAEANRPPAFGNP